MSANVCRALLTVFLALCLLSGATASDEFSDALMQDICVECGSAGEHLESCSLYVIPDIIDDSFDTDIPDIVEEPLNPEFSGDDLSSSDAVSSGDDSSSSDLLTESTEPPVQPSFAEQLLASDDLWGMYSQMLSAMDEDLGILYALTADELAVLKEHANLLYLSIPEPTYDDTMNWDDIIATLTVLEEELAGTYEPVSVYANVQPLTDSTYIYFDLSAGDVTIDGNYYSGSYYDSSNRRVTISGGHSPSNKYYVYQSNTNTNHKPTISAENTLISVPQYNRVQSPTGSGRWGDYITNNSDVKAVITNWKTQAGKVGRTSTPHKISVTGSGTYDLTIDNLWSSHQDSSTSRTTGGLSFTPDNNGKLTVHIVGDNRFGNIHYDATEGQKAQIIFDSDSENSGTLTVANLDENSGRNHYNSAIGGNDSSSDSAVGIMFNGGIIFAGTTAEDNCSAIGGGGNGLGVVIINGGIITAVAESSGAAIGGGIGNTSYGGEGRVTITGGTVYAYNMGSYGTNETDNPFIPAAAIGGGSSCDLNGNKGTVIISGGSVYAESLGGAAIGGGSSTKSYGGIADVTITGGNIIAKSVSGTAYPSGSEHKSGSTQPFEPFAVSAGSGIGGGTAGSKGTGNGGSAILVVSDGVIQTGSIGGGGCVNTKGTVGSANVTISGGTLLGQVIMQGKDSNGNPSSFTMTGGTIDNADRAGYNFLQNDGGAVWINSGEAEMSGGTIKNANAVNGGAIYVNGGSFVMSGDGTIRDCFATENGGAVYVSGGKVTMSDGTIKDVSAKEGGAVYVNAESTSEDSFTMSGGIIQNAEATSGNGGAVAVANGKASMSGGSIKSSTASLNGGAVSVSGGSFIMDGGSIGGTDSEKCTAANGGAVAVNGGTFTMTSGIIQNSTSTEDGGAVYVSVTGIPLGDSFTMSDSASIMNCTASGNGGAICVEGGSASMSGGSIKSSTAPSGNGGAVSVSNGNFAMSGGTIGDYDAVCSAKNGGAVSVTGGTFTMSGASAVTYCNATENGGAVYVSVTGTPSVDSFTMSETSSIQNCNAVKDGGAVYVSGGSARMLNGDIEKCSAVNGGAVSVSGGNFRIDFGDVSECTASSNGGAVYVSTGNFVMDSGNLTLNTASGDGGGAYVTGGSITIGNVSCENVKVDTHVHPTTKNNEANNGGAFTVSGGTLTIYCGEYSGNKATLSNSNSIYQTNGKVYIYKGVDGNSLPLSEVLITGNTFVYTDARSTILTVTLYRSPDDTIPVSKLVDSTKYHSIRLNKSLLEDSSPLYTGTQLMGWSLNKSDTNSTVIGNPKEYYPENSKYPINGGGSIKFYAIWGNSNDVLTYTIIIPDSFDITADGNLATIKIDTSSPFFIPDSVGRVDVKLSEFTGELTLQNKNDQTLSYSLKKKDETELYKDSVVASFRYDKENNYKSQDVTLSAEVKDEPIYAGTYQETVTFTASFVMDAYDLGDTDKTCYTGGTP